MSSSNDWFLWAILSATFAALTAIFSKVGVQGVDSDCATLIRTLFISLILGVFVWQTGKASSLSAIPTRTLLFLLLSAIATGASWLCYFRALQMGPASKVAGVDKFSVVLVMVFAVIFLGERPRMTDWLGIGLVTCGLVAMAWKR